jgi:hypothetical protein
LASPDVLSCATLCPAAVKMFSLQIISHEVVGSFIQFGKWMIVTGTEDGIIGRVL